MRTGLIRQGEKGIIRKSRFFERGILEGGLLTGRKQLLGRSTFKGEGLSERLHFFGDGGLLQMRAYLRGGRTR